jgi:hypothetical protein
MTKRARFDGAEAVKVTWPPGEVYPEQTYIVEPGHWLPDDAPAALRDEVLQRDDWTEVQQNTSRTPDKGDDEKGKE